MQQKLFKRVMPLLMLLLCHIAVKAQQTISGTVTDNSGEPLMGVSIKVVGTTTGVATDLDGKFTLPIPEGKHLIQLSMIGFKTQVLRTTGKSTFVIKMEEDTALLEETVVVGYGAVKKRDLTGAVSQIKAEELMAGGSVDIAHGLQGKIAGVQVNQNDGAPGAGVSITVRGANSFTTSSQPLYIVDGIPYETGSTPTSGANEGTNQTSNPLAMINPNSIEKIEVLKDASATAIYGSRGANGVVIITTKKGQKGEGKPKIEFTAGFSISAIGKRVKTLDPYTYALYQNEANANSVKYEGATSSAPYSGEGWTYPNGNAEYKPGPEDFLNPGIRVDAKTGKTHEIAVADWQDEIYRTGCQQEYNLSVSGGSDAGWYSFSGNYTNQNGIIKSSGFDRYGLSINIGRHIFRWLEIGTSSHFTQTVTDFQRTNSGDYGIIRSALIFPPTYGPLTDVTQMDNLNWLAANPVGYINGAKDQLKQISWFSSNYIEIKLLKSLKFRQNLGAGYNDGHRSTFYDTHTQEGKSPINGKYGKASNIWKSLTSESLLTFDNTFGVHHLNAVAGMTFEKGIWENSSMTATGYPYFANVKSDIGFGLNRPQVSSDEGKHTLESFLARVNYTLLDKYLFTASMRSDGSSSFATNNKWATFFSGAFAWRASEENFIRNLNVFDNLKFRASFGQTGNQGIGSYRTLTQLEPSNYAYQGTLSGGVAMIDWRGPTNPNLKWETTNQFNVGVDFGFLGNRLQLTVDYYFKKTFDLLQNVSLPYSSTFGNMLVNSGNVTNEGLEISAFYDVFKGKKLKWTINANIAFNKNKIGGLDGDQYATALWSSADQVFLQRNGCPMGTLYGYVEDGFFNNVAEVLAFPDYANLSESEAMKKVGEIKYRDLNGDGKITSEDRTIIGDTNPKFTYSITNNLNYKNWSLSFMLQGSQGNDIFNANLMDIKMSNIGNITQKAYDNRWRADNTEGALWPKAIAGYTRTWYISNRYVENGSYLKMKYITLAYEWHNLFKCIDNLKLSFTVNNVFTITKYSWFDPDVNAFGSDASRRGVDAYSYPSARTFALGVNVIF